MVANAGIEQQAKILANEYRMAEPDLHSIYWFPDSSEIRLIEVLPDGPLSTDGRVFPFYFLPSPEDGLTAPSSVAIIRPEEVGHVDLPPDWPTWDEAVNLLEPEK